MSGTASLIGRQAGRSAGATRVHAVAAPGKDADRNASGAVLSMGLSPAAVPRLWINGRSPRGKPDSNAVCSGRCRTHASCRPAASAACVEQVPALSPLRLHAQASPATGRQFHTVPHPQRPPLSVDFPNTGDPHETPAPDPCRHVAADDALRRRAKSAADAACRRTTSKHVMYDAAQLKWGDAPPALERGAQAAVLSGDPGSPGPFVLRLKFPAGYKVATHWHPTDEHVTVIEGRCQSGHGRAWGRPACACLRSRRLCAAAGEDAPRSIDEARRDRADQRHGPVRAQLR